MTSTNPVVQNAIRSTRRAISVCNASPNDSVGKFLRDEIEWPRNEMRGVKMNVSFKKAFDEMKNGTAVDYTLNLTSSDQRYEVLQEMARVLRLPFNGLYDLNLYGPKDARVVKKYGKALGLKEMESPATTKFKKMVTDYFWKKVSEEALKKFWQKNRNVLVKELDEDQGFRFDWMK